MQVILVCFWAFGCGDLMFAVRTTQLLKKYWPQIDLKIMTNAAEQFKELYGAEANDFLFIKPRALTTSDGTFAIQVPALNTPLSRVQADPQIRVLTIHEYAGHMLDKKAQLSDLHTGFGSQSLGFFVDEEVVCLKGQGRALLDQLDDLSLKDQILNGQKSDSYQNPLYFAYSSQPLPLCFYEFIRLVLTASIDESEDIDFCLIGPSFSFLPDFLKSVCPSLIDLGIRQLNLVPGTVIFQGVGKKKIRLIRQAKLDHRDFIKLLAASQSLVCVTGDQSLSEAVCLGKLPFYELLPHKIYSFSQLMALAKEKAPLLASFMHLSACFLPLDDKSDWDYLMEGIAPPRLDKRPYNELIPLLKQKELYQQCENLSLWLCEHRNFEKNLISYLNQFTLFQQKPLQASGKGA